MKREALERCREQWQQIHTELYKMEAAQRDGELFPILNISMLERKVLRRMGVADDDHPINSCYLCEYVQTEHPTPGTEPIACEHCPLKGYAWEQCETDGPYQMCKDAIDAEHYAEAAQHAQEIIDACDRALGDLDNEE